MASKQNDNSNLEKSYGYVWDKYRGKELEDLFAFSEG